MVDDIATSNLETVSRKRKRTPTKSGSSSSSSVIGNGSNSCGGESVVIQKGRKLKQYVLEEKLDIIDYAKIIGNRAAGREFNVAESSIREWRKNEQRLRSMFETTPERSRLDGGGRRPVSEDLEKGLLQYVTSRSDGEISLTWHDIKEKANELWKDICKRNPEYNDRGFTANMGWVARFVRRNNITLQVTNSASTIAPKLVISNSSSSSSSNSGRIAIDDLVAARNDTNSILSSNSEVVTNMDSTLSSTKSTISSPDVTNVDGFHRTNIVVMDTVATTITAIASSVSVKRRRKNFTPKKVVPNDVVCLADNNKTAESIAATTKAATQGAL